MAFSNDGRWLASGSLDSKAKIWDIATGVCVQTLDHPGQVFAVAFSTDGSCLASGSIDHKIRLWEAASGTFREMRVIHTKGKSTRALVFSPNGKWLASWSCESDVEMHDAKTGNFVYRFAVRRQPKMSLSFSTDSQYILTGNYYPFILKIEDHSWVQWYHTIQGHLLGYAPSPEGKWVGHVYGTGGHWIWTISKEKCTQVLEMFREDGLFQPDPEWQRELRPSAISNDCKQIATCTMSPFQLVVVDVETRPSAFTNPRIHRGHWDSLPESMAWSADSRWLAVGSTPGQITIWDPKAIRSDSKAQETHTNMHAMAFTADHQSFACGLENGIIKIQSVADPGMGLHTLEGHSSLVTAIVFSSNGNMLATRCASLIKIWNIESTGQCLCTIKTGLNDARPWAMAFSADESIFAFNQGMDKLNLHNLTGQSMYTLKMDRTLDAMFLIESLAFSPDGLSLAAGKGPVVQIWDLRSKGAHMLISEAWEFPRRCNGKGTVVFSNNGKLLAHHANPSGMIYIWQMPEEICILKLSTKRNIRQLSFGRDGRSLITEYGRFVPEYWPSDIDMQANSEDVPDVPFAIQGYGVGFDDVWLTKDGKRFVWLPPEHRPSSENEKPIFTADSVVATLNSSSQLSMYYFDHGQN